MGLDLCALSYIEDAHPFGSIKFMGRGAEQRDPQLIHIDGQMTEGLDGVGVKRNPFFRRQCADLAIG